MRRAVVAGALTALLALAPVMAAEAAPPAGLSVSIQRDGGAVRSGDRLTYTATVRNEGSGQVEGRLVITVPDYLRVADAEGADRSGSDTRWRVTVPAGATVSEKLTGVLERVPKGQVRVTTLVSLYLGDQAQATIRSADAAAIAGVRDPAHAAGDRPAVPAGQPWLIALVGLAILVVVAIGALAAWRLVIERRRRLQA